MSEKTANLLKELKEKTSEGLETRKIDEELGVQLLGIIRELNAELKNSYGDNSYELRGMINELHGIGATLHNINQQLSKRR